MDQDEIYNLLLLILLMSNSRDGNDSAQTAQGSLNELILASMLLNNCNNRSFTNSDDSSCSCRRNRTNSSDTTF